MRDRARPTIGFFIPSGIGLGYTGPGIFLKRLVGPLSSSIGTRIYAGKRPGHEIDPEYVPERSMNVGGSGPIRQLAWAITATWWVICDRKRLDLVHLHGTYLYKLAPAIACIVLRIPYVLVPLASKADFSLSGKTSRIPGIRSLTRLIARHSAGAFALGEEIADELRSAGVPAQKTHLIMNPVSQAFFGDAHPERASLKTLLFVGILGNRKRPALILEALQIARRFEPGTRAVFVGPFQNEAYREAFYSTIEDLELQNVVEHVGFSDDVADFMLNRSTLFILLSETEGIPGALVEAMAAGLPCIVTDAGAMAQLVIDGGAGAVVAADPVSVAGTVVEFLAGTERWRETSASARAFALENFDASAVSQRYLAAVQGLLAE